MATYTDNYTMTKPTYAEQADISVINANMDIIDNVMHSSQISLAPAYDINETYNTGDIVMHELLMYKCLEDNVTGVWDSTKWTRTTAGEESGGGADLDIYGEASGTAEASFSDGAEASLVECEIGIVPTQDLHGYSKPWAGGAGKNKLNASSATTNTVNGVTFTVVKNDANEVIRIDVTGTANAGTTFSIGTATIEAGTYIFSGYTDGSSVGTKYINFSGIVNAYGSDATATITETKTTTVTLQIGNGAETEFSIYPMIRISTAPSGFEPYSNICPISGHTDVTVTVASTSGGSGEDYTVSLGTTYYGGNLDVTTGELEVTWGNIASYAGETLTGEWLSSLDEYSALGTPTTGAQVVYELATPQTFNLTPTQVKTLLGQNYVSHDGGGTISLVYVKGDAPIKPNPADAEIPLTGLEIDGEKFSIPQKGQYTETTLWEGSGYTDSIWNLSDDYTNYDAIAIYVRGGTSDNYITSHIIPVSVLDVVRSNSNLRYGITTDGWYSWFYVRSTTQFERADTGTLYVNKIIGIKFNG